MTDLELDIEIINNEKKEVSLKHKTTLFSILGGLWMLLLISQPTKENSIYDKLEIWKGYPLILFIILLLSSGLVIMYVFFMVPSKGRLIINPTGMTIIQKKTKKHIQLNKIQSVIFYIYRTDLEETNVYIDLTSEQISLSNEINIAFMNERETLKKIIEEWKKIGINIDLKTTPPNTVQIP